MTTYTAEVTRDGKWWMVAIPQIHGLTQARRLAEAEQMARDYIAVTLDVPPRSVDVEVSIRDVGGIDVADRLAEIQDSRERIAGLEAETRDRTSHLARSLAAVGVPVRDIGTLMGVSFQRAHQLVTG